MTIAAYEDPEEEAESLTQAKMDELLRSFLLQPLRDLGHHADALVVALGDHGMLIEMYYQHYNEIVKHKREKRHEVDQVTLPPA